MPKASLKSSPRSSKPAPRRAGLQTWPVFVAAALVAGACWLLFAHVRSSQAGPSPAPSVFAGIHIPSQGHQGHAQGDAKRYAHFLYSSQPPTSGFHLEIFSPSFVNQNPLPEYVQVHLLEHGNILLQYNCVCPDVANALAGIANEYNGRLLPQGAAPTLQQVQNTEENGLAVVVAPYPAMKHTIALTAWTRLATMDSVNKDDVVSFINRWQHDADNLSQ